MWIGCSALGKKCADPLRSESSLCARVVIASKWLSLEEPCTPLAKLQTPLQQYQAATSMAPSAIPFLTAQGVSECILGRTALRFRPRRGPRSALPTVPLKPRAMALLSVSSAFVGASQNARLLVRLRSRGHFLVGATLAEEVGAFWVEGLPWGSAPERGGASAVLRRARREEIRRQSADGDHDRSAKR